MKKYDAKRAKNAENDAVELKRIQLEESHECLWGAILHAIPGETISKWRRRALGSG